MIDEEAKQLLEQNLAKNEEMYQMMKKIQRYFVLAQIFSVIRILFVAVPLILAIIFLPPLLQGLFGDLSGTLDSLNTAKQLNLFQ